MSCILGLFWKKEEPKEDPESYKGAGMVFTDGKLILAGYQPLKSKPFISGFGGSKMDSDVDYFQTATRETLEELFDLRSVPDRLMSQIRSIFQTSKVYKTNGYVFLKYDFSELKLLIGIVNAFGLKSRLYDTMPKNLSELMLNRKIIGDEKTEITHLCLLPLVNHPIKLPFVDLNLLQDMTQLLSGSV